MRPDRHPAARAKKIDGRLVGALIALPVALTGANEVEEFQSLAVRDLERGQGVGLPSGEGDRPSHGRAAAERRGGRRVASAGWHERDAALVHRAARS